MAGAGRTREKGGRELGKGAGRGSGNAVGEACVAERDVAG